MGWVSAGTGNREGIALRLRPGTSATAGTATRQHRQLFNGISVTLHRILKVYWRDSEYSLIVVPSAPSY